MKRRLKTTWFGYAALCWMFPAVVSAEQAVSFVRDIRPILSDKCFACHGPDERTREADLRLDVREDATADVLAAQADQPSLLMQRVLSEDEDLRMPPAHTRKELSEKEIDLLRRWIEAGAEYETHWAYRPLERPILPPIKEGSRIHPSQLGNPVDHFILNRLQDHGLDFSAPADKITLVRRLYLDLLGLPPTPDDVDAFANDDSPDAVEKLVDRLLRDPRFGERMSVHWLDLVRYADTIGYHSDTYMEVSAYRDYVIQSFNNNKPFDLFTVEQLAGDLLDQPNESQLVASGYNRLLQTTEEGGAQAKEYIAIYAADRVRNVAGVWMGMTVGCAQCHDHKYDPVTMRDFYSLAAFFADIKENAVGKRKPNLKLYSDADKAKLQSLNDEVAALRLPKLLATNAQLAASLEKGQEEWETKIAAATAAGDSVWKSPEPSQVDADGGVVLKRQEDGSYLSTAGNPDKGTYTYRIETSGPVHAIRLEVFSDASFPNQGFSRGNGNIVLTSFTVSAGEDRVEIGSATADYQQGGWPVEHAIDNKDPSGWAIDGHHKKADKRTALFRLKEPIDFADGAGTLTIQMKHQSAHARHLVGRFRISLSDHAGAGLESDSVPKEVLAAINVPQQQRSEQQSKLISNHYRGIATELQPWKKKLADAEKALNDFEASVRTTLVTETLAEPRMTRILPRGNWLDDSGEVVQPAVPQFLPHSPIDDRRANRLDLAKWLIDRRNPLTPRTFVNRLWKLYFGHGLSRNLDDLGGQGQPPTHPELLDWLAVEFRDSGWDVKHMVRLLVTSATYAQSSVGTKELREIDPDNQLYARQGRWRLEAEFVRDTALSIAGLLRDNIIGGKSVKPYQPAGYWRHLNFPTRKWQADQGESLYRRSVYTFWCRTFLHPAMLAFDATSREECTAQRAKSNIPQQALVLLNDPTFVEAARVFGKRILDAPGGKKAKIGWAFRTAISRSPTDAEAKLVLALYENQLQRYQNSGDDAQALLSVGAAPHSDHNHDAQQAAWTQVARAIISLYETTSRF